MIVVKDTAGFVALDADTEQLGCAQDRRPNVVLIDERRPEIEQRLLVGLWLLDRRKCVEEELVPICPARTRAAVLMR